MNTPSNTNNPLQLGNYRCGTGEPLLLIAGPCVLESSAAALEIAQTLQETLSPLNVQLVFKASFDKANRTSLSSARGPGMREGLDMLQAMNTGHDGSLGTVHANSPRDALSRLETMVLMAGLELPSRAMREQIVSALDLIVHGDRYEDDDVIIGDANCGWRHRTREQ